MSTDFLCILPTFAMVYNYPRGLIHALLIRKFQNFPAHSDSVISRFESL